MQRGIELFVGSVKRLSLVTRVAKPAGSKSETRNDAVLALLQLFREGADTLASRMAVPGDRA